MPDQVMRLEDAGLSSATAYDFNLAVMALAATIEARLQETVEEEYAPPTRNPKTAIRHVPRYTLAQLLYDDSADDDPDDDGPVSEALAHLPTAML